MNDRWLDVSNLHAQKRNCLRTILRLKLQDGVLGMDGSRGNRGARGYVWRFTEVSGTHSIAHILRKIPFIPPHEEKRFTSNR